MRLIGTSLAVIAMCIPYSTSAQVTAQQHANDPVDQVDADDDVQIVITGSRAATSGFDAPTPTLVIGDALVKQQSAATIAQVLYQEPAFKATRSPGANALNVGNPGQAAADLRGLGPQRTLVLVNGARVVPAAASISASNPVTTDLNLIPTMMIERVEVVTGGASAQYGSDAVAGVVNMLLKRSAHGLEVTGQAGLSQQGDNLTLRIGALTGFDFGGGRGHLVGSLEFNRSDGLGDIYTRDWGREEYQIVSNANFATNGLPANILSPNVHNYLAAGGLIVGPANFSLRGVTFNGDGTTRPYDAGTLNNGTFQIGGEGKAAYANVELAPPVERLTAYARAQYEVSEALILSLEGGYSQSISTLTGAIPRFSGLPISRQNPFLPTAVRTAMTAQNVNVITVSKTWYDMGNAGYRVSNRTPHVMIGAEGDLGGDWHYDAHYSYGENRFRSDVTNNLVAANLTFALDAVTDPVTQQPVCRAVLPGASFNAAAAGCVPVNPFGPNSATADAQAYINKSGFSTSIYRQNAAGVNVRGKPFSTWAGPVSVAFGAEYRRESQVVDADPLSAGFRFSFAGNVGVFSGNFNVKEGYVETLVPLLRDLPFARALNLNAAIRYADYSSVGGQTTWKVGGVYEPVSGLRLRMTRSRDIRAPAIFELKSPGSIVANLITVKGVTARVPQNASIGNPNLQAEIADTFTVGAVADPAIANGRIRASIDYYDINLNSAITSYAGSTIGTLCSLGQQQFCNYITFDATGVTPVRVDAPVQNIGALRTRGIDGQIAYTVPVGREGSVNLSLSGTYIFDALLSSGAPGVAPIDRAGENSQANLGALPTFRGNASVTYSNPALSLTLQGIFISKGTLDNSNNTTAALSINNNNVPAIAYLNSYGTVHVAPQIDLTFAINNLFDQDPPPVPSLIFSTPTNGIYYDKVGRSFQVGANLRF